MTNIDDITKYENANQEIKLLVYNGMLCNDTKISEDGELKGDPTENSTCRYSLKIRFYQKYI